MSMRQSASGSLPNLSRTEAKARPPFVAVRWRRGLEILDQRLLPGRVVWQRPHSADEVIELIRGLAVRGAPLIGVAAAYGVALEAARLGGSGGRRRLVRACDRLAAARPTAVNLGWAVARMRRVIAAVADDRQLPARLLAAARELEAEERERSYAIARHGAVLVPPGGVVMTICNTGSLAGPGVGTALGIVLQAHAAGRRPSVLALETRPLLQGARLTALELVRAGIPVRLLPDSAAASAVKDCDLVLAGADRIARNGDTANKVGTLMLAILARRAGRPMVMAAPGSTWDPATATGADIPIEQRSAAEVLGFGGCRVAPRGVGVYNPAFDVTPAGLISAIVTERGIARPPLGRSLSRLVGTMHKAPATGRAGPAPKRQQTD